MWQDKLKTGLIVVLLTGLVWFFADQADTDSKVVSLRLTVQPPSSSYQVMSQQPEKLEFEVTFRAPRGVIRDISQEVQARPLAATFVPDRPDKDGGYARMTFEAAKVLSQLDEIRKRGLTITSVRPETFTIELDAMVRRPMRIKPEFGDLVVEKEDPRPASVDVILPSQMAQALADDTLQADVTRYVDTSKPDVWQTPTVQLQWPQADDPLARHVRFEPAGFEVRFRLKDTTAQRTFQSVPVWFSSTYEVLSRYTPMPVKQAEFLPDVVVAGPKQTIDNLRKEDILLTVLVYGSDEANVGQPITRQVKSQVPPGVQLVTQLRDVRFVLQEKPSANGRTAGG